MVTHKVPLPEGRPERERRIVEWLAAVRVLPVLTVTDVESVAGHLPGPAGRRRFVRRDHVPDRMRQ